MRSSLRQWACITGATSGIGEAFAQEFAKKGCHLILTGRREAKLESLAEDLRKKNEIEVEVESGDFSDRKVINDLSAKLKDNKDLRILINNAGFGAHNYFDQENVKIYENMLLVHELAVIRLTHSVLPRMIAATEGMIINVASTAAFTPHPLNAVYAANKSMVKLFSESLFLELKGTGVYVQALCPGITRTEFHERIGLNKERIYNKKGIMRAMDPDKVVQVSLACARKNKPVCVPGWNNKLIRLFLKWTPAPLMYWAVRKHQMPSRRV